MSRINLDPAAKTRLFHDLLLVDESRVLWLGSRERERGRESLGLYLGLLLFLRRERLNVIIGFTILGKGKISRFYSIVIIFFRSPLSLSYSII